MVFILELGLGTLASRSYGLSVVTVERATWLGVVELGAILVIASDEKGDAEGATHDALLAIGALAEAEGQVAYGLGAALDTQILVVVEGVRLALDAGMLDHAARVCLQSRHGAADVPVDLDNLLDGRGLQQRRRHSLLYAQHHAL